ncbi:MAG: hypothetical protein WC223_03895 [Bacteroidales bacterium]|jgi:hypothetical protein
MKKNNLVIAFLILSVSTFGQTLIKGKIEEIDRKNVLLDYLLKTENEIYCLKKPIQLSWTQKDLPTMIVKYKIDKEKGISKEKETIFNIDSKKISFGNVFRFGNNETKSIFIGYSQEFVDNNFTLKKGIKGRFVVEKYDVEGKMINSFGVDKKTINNKDYFFDVAVSENGKHIGIINNTDYSVYNSEDFKLEKIFKLKIMPEKDKATFFVLSDGSLIFVTKTNPIIVTKCDIKTGDVKAIQIAFNNENNFGAVFKIAEDEKCLMIACCYNDQKNSDANTTLVKGIQLFGIDLSSFELKDNIDYSLGDDIRAKMEYKKKIEYLSIIDIFKIKDDYIIITNNTWTYSSKYGSITYNNNILLLKANNNNKSFNIIKRSDFNADLYTYSINGKPYIIYSNDTKSRATGSETNKSKLLSVEVDGNLNNKITFKEDFTSKQIKLVDLRMYKMDMNNYFLIVKEKDQLMPIVLTF